MRKVLRHPLTWFAAWAAWLGTLWWLSSGVRAFPPGMSFEFSDKVLHFGYFLGGGGLAAGFFYLLGGEPANWKRVLLLAVLATTLVGVLDEWHQSHVPGRSGNDPADLTADFLGALAGACLFRKGHRVLA